MNANTKYTLIVFNTCTQKYEEVTVTEEVYRAYCRTGWNIKDNDQSFFDHEIQLSGMIGSQDGAYENFREFVDSVCILRHTAAVGAVVQRPLCGLSSGRN